MQIEKYSFGVGDRFGHQAKAQLSAIQKANSQGIDIVPVWNKSHREHTIIGTEPASVRTAADQAVKACGYDRAYYVDADHINFSNVDAFLESSDFFTIDVADFIGKKTDDANIKAFMDAVGKYSGRLEIPGIEHTFKVDQPMLQEIADTYLYAIEQASAIYQHIEKAKGPGNFVAEVSMDETEQAQTPVELFFILIGLSRQGVRVQTIAPKFTGRFNKGVDYVGNPKDFEKEFFEDTAVVKFAQKEFNFPQNLKLSVHSGSDKFSIYGPIYRTLEHFDAGVHVKTAGTTWLEELIGLAMAGGEALELSKRIYADSLDQFDELCEPYASVIDIDKKALPDAAEVEKWNGEQFAQTLRHDPECSLYNPNFRQLLHVGYKVAAKMGKEYIDSLEANERIIAEHVTENLYERHILPIFMGK